MSVDHQLTLSRRQFLRLAGVGVGAIAANRLLGELEVCAAMQARTVIVVGAGLAGLCAAYELERRGHKVVLLEAERSHLGGRVRTLRFEDGLYGELGAMRVPHSHELTHHYITQFGLTTRPFVQFNPNAYYYVDGHRQRVKAVRHFDKEYTLGMAARPGTIWNEKFVELVGGMDRLPTAFAARLKSKPRPGCAVVKIEQDAIRHKVAALYRTNRDGSLSGPIQRVEGDFLICTLPLPILRRIPVEPALSAAKQRAMREMPYLASGKTIAVAAHRFWETDDGIFGGGTYTDLPNEVIYYPSDNAKMRKADISRGAGVLLASYSIGKGAQKLAALAPEERSALVMKNLARVHPQVAHQGLITHVESWSWDNHKWSGGGFAYPDQGSNLLRLLSAPQGRIFFAGEHTSHVHTWMQGALESGLRAAREVIVAVAG